MINNKNMPLFVQDIWPILVNFLLRAKHESIVISKIFEDIAFCLFDKDIFESSLVCFIVSIISGSKSMNEIILDKVDFLLSWFLRNSICDTLNFSSIHIINIIMNKINILKKDIILWRCQFIRLFYGQFLSDFGCIGSLNYSIPTDLLGSNDSFEQSGFIKRNAQYLKLEILLNLDLQIIILLQSVLILAAILPFQMLHFTSLLLIQSKAVQ